MQFVLEELLDTFCLSKVLKTMCGKGMRVALATVLIIYYPRLTYMFKLVSVVTIAKKRKQNEGC